MKELNDVVIWAAITWRNENSTIAMFLMTHRDHISAQSLLDNYLLEL